MNLPNKLTVLRVIMIPIFLAFFFLGKTGVWGCGFLAALITFALASLTDTLDGRIARKHGLITDFGKLMDPLADKLLVMSAMVSFIVVDLVHPVIVIVILAREFLVTSIRLIAASNGTVIAADGWGKMKTIFQMVWICYGLLALSVQQLCGFGGIAQLPAAFSWINIVLVVVVTALTVISGFNYTWKNRSLFADA